MLQSSAVISRKTASHFFFYSHSIHTTMSHSLLSPSGAKGWSTCTASVGYIQRLKEEGKIPEEQTSVYADEGTEAHQHANDILDGLQDLDEVPEGEMRQCVGDYVAFAERIGKDADQVLVEERVPLFYRPEDGGTVDYAAITSERVQILDLKYGKGVIVEARENLQGAIYAKSLIESQRDAFDFTDDTLVVITIFQPRTYEGNPIKIWSVTLRDLNEFLGDIQKIADRIDAGMLLEFKPSPDTCQFCDAKGLCKARQNRVADPIIDVGIEAAKDFTDLDGLPDDKTEPTYPTMGELSDEQIAVVVKHGKGFEKWLKSVASEAKKRIEGGIPITGLKVVAGKLGNRGWNDEAAADTLIAGKLKASERYTRKLVTLPQAEKLLKGMDLSTRFENRFKELTQRKPGAPILVTDADDRPSIMEAPEDMFTSLEEDDSPG